MGRFSAAGQPLKEKGKTAVLKEGKSLLTVRETNQTKEAFKKKT